MKFQLKTSRKFLQIILIMALTVVSGCSSDAIEERLAAAEEALHQQHYATAILKLKGILRDTPDNRPALKLLGLAYYKVEAYDEAAQKIKQIIDTPAADALTQLAYADSLIQLNQHRAAHDTIKQYSFSAEFSARATAIEAIALVGLGKFNDANKITETAISNFPDSPELNVAMSKIYLAQGKHFASIRSARRAVTLAPMNRRVHDQLGSLLLSERMFADAVDAFLNALQTTPSQDAPLPVLRTQLKLLRSYLALGNLDKAKETLAKLQSISPAHPAVTYFSALIQFNEKDYENAYQNTLATLVKIPNHRPSELMAGIISYRLNNPEQANMYLGRVLADDPKNSAARKLFAATQIKLDNPGGASQTLRAGLQIAPDDLSLKEIINELQNVSQEIGSTSRLTLEDALAEGQPAPLEKVIASLEGQQSDPINDEVQAIRQLVDTGDAASAFSRVLKLLDSNPNNADLNEFAGIIAQLSGHPEDANSFFLRTITIKPNAISSALNLINLHRRTPTLNSAETALTHALVKAPGSYALLAGLAKIAADNQQIESAASYLQKAISSNPKNPDPRIALIKLYRQHHRNGDAAKILATGLTAFPTNGPLRIADAQQMIVAGRPEAAVKVLQSVLLDDPTAANALLTLAIALSKLDRPDEAIDPMRRAHQLIPNSYKVTARLISLETQLGNDDQALTIAGNYLDVTQDKAGSEALIGGIRRAQADYQAAAQHYSNAVDLNPSEPLVVLQTASTQQAGNSTQAINIAQRWLAVHPEHKQIRTELAAMQMFAGNFDAAAREYQHLIDQQIITADIYNNLAWIYQQLNDPRALPLADKGHKQFPDDFLLMDTLGWLLVIEKKELNRAISLLKSSFQNTQIHSIGFHLAQAFFQNGDRRNSLATLKTILNSGKKFPELGEAQALKRVLEQ